MIPAPTFQVNVQQFDQRMREFIAISGMDIIDAIRTQARLLGAEMIKRTPPLSGRAITRTLESRGASVSWRDAEIEGMSARQVGIRRVNKDISRVILGVDPGSLKSATHKAASLVRGQQTIGFGVLQRCEGKVAVRIFSTKSGTVYGVDTENFKPNASTSDMARVHQQSRGKRGRVTTAGMKTRDVGRWRWVDKLVTNKRNAERYIRQKQKSVGQAKGGWVSGCNALGMNISTSGWYGRHYRAGSVIDHLRKGEQKPFITWINKSKWASGGDDDRIISKSMEGRAIRLAADIKRRLDGTWRKWGK